MVSYKKKILLQAILVCFFTFISTTIWAILGFLPNNSWMPILMHIGDFSWFMMHSMPAVIYLTFNETIRSKVVLIFGLAKKKFKVYSAENFLT
ncbi:unnamed protein product, partial [Mesorhabditis belari]|uniref:Uncharacterized protein n=1 Tax=Mesorhabditis belari TaxID=2138241 RepID=A0AAF3FI60_9BILA